MKTSQSSNRGAVLFHIRDSNVVVTRLDGQFVTILKDGVSNQSVQSALKNNVIHPVLSINK
ncbi:hypothetical protein VQ643_03305 [Pseudomonas sp. F1_0610]|uniref:hypothetical protein n=1 Tax=Pseudomonas sp. F1_0610 TaxID=3114284 RepID=UPI0039C25FD9